MSGVTQRLLAPPRSTGAGIYKSPRTSHQLAFRIAAMRGQPIQAPVIRGVEQQMESLADEAAAPQGEGEKKKKKFLVIGGGWGGWGAAKALCESGVDAEVTLLDALPDPTGATPYQSKTGKPVEAGTRGFWKDYPNINKLCAELGISEYDVFTPFTNSSFYSPDGLEATAPVFSEAKLPKLPENIPFLSQFSEQSFPQLPSPLGQVVATSQLFERIPLQDRASMLGLLIATVDCLGGDEKVQEQYDRMTAHELFLRFGLSKRLVDDFVRPTLLVGLFKPPEELSALVVMELLYYYALAHQDSFDVRWIRSGTVSDSLIAPLAEKLQKEHGLHVMGGSRVGQISLSNDGSKLTASKIEYSTMSGETKSIEDVDGVVLALGCKGMEAVVRSSPDLAKLPEFSMAASLKGIDVISTRIWLDRVVPTRTPANVFSRFKELRGAGGTFFMLDQLQENDETLWGGEKPQGSVVACDFYNAGALLSLTDDEIVRILMEYLLPSAVSRFADAKVVDSWVGKYPGTVSWFSPGSYKKRPPLEGAGPVLPNVKCAGDWVRMGDREHGAKGLCQERAFVSGFEAANSLLRDTMNNREGNFQMHPVLPIRDDEAQFKAAVAVNNQVMTGPVCLPRFWVQ
eukprot:gnl/MRDRNA2_/MRDRNA2_107294_c0_seq1.p1 gnl/MRDRNA2_/MRDRNA2_107294_c0~~gnl/MRDRNA2_/MRDRNA2_107294_c0_seq1.p1  ORF type:complete len:677 (-),score=135.39 gnl/MRDRNA2_/MRDRNA2_107294_c0_seq1:324-2204(-)